LFRSVRYAMKGARHTDQLGGNRRIMRLGASWHRTVEAQGSIVMMPTGVHLHDVRLSIAQHPCSQGPATQLDVARIVKRGSAVTDKRLQVSFAQSRKDRRVEGEVWFAVAVRPGEVRHATACDHDCPQPKPGDG